MMDTRRSKRTPKPKRVAAAKIPKPKSAIKKIANVVSDASIENEGISEAKILQPETNVVTDTDVTTEKGIEEEIKTKSDLSPTSENVATGGSGSVKVRAGDTRNKNKRTLGRFLIGCGDLTVEKKIDLNALKIHLQDKIKIQGKRNDKRVKVDVQDNSIIIHAAVFIEKKYIKYLVKIFLKGKKLNNWVRIVQGKHSYALVRKENLE